MAELPTVASLWIGGTLTWVERLSLKSFVDKGHHTVLYTYEPVEGVPEGVEVRDGSTIADIASMPRHGRTGSPALFSDLFRYHMMVKAPGEIWIDTDMLCWQPLEGLGDHVFGYEAPHQLNGAILRLPPDSEALGQLLEFTKDEYSIADFLSDEMKMDYAEAAQTGAPVHVSEQPWGIWGPLALTHFLKKTGEARFAEKQSVYYPIHYRDRKLLFQRPAKVMRALGDDTKAIHLWARRIKRFAAKRFQGQPRDDIFFGWAMKEHGLPLDEGGIGLHEDEYRLPFVPAEEEGLPPGKRNLTMLADIYQSDKGSKKHRYTELYDLLFQPYRDRKITFLEMGLQMGGPEHSNPASRETTDAPSVRMWLEYFSKANIIGLDVSDFSWIEADRFKFIQCDMDDRDAIREATKVAPSFDIIIDDASHASSHQQDAFLEFFPKLKSGGLYIIEDLQWQPPAYEKPPEEMVKTRDFFQNYLASGRFSHPNTETAAEFNALRDQMSGCFVFQHHYRKDKIDKVVVIHKA